VQFIGSIFAITAISSTDLPFFRIRHNNLKSANNRVIYTVLVIGVVVGTLGTNDSKQALK